MARNRPQAHYLHAMLNRLGDAGFQGVLGEALELPHALYRPLERLSVVLNLPPALLWAAVTALIGCAVLALSWILTSLILAVTRSNSVLREHIDREPYNEDVQSLDTAVRRSPLPDRRSHASRYRNSSNRSPLCSTSVNASPVSSWPLVDGDSDEKGADGDDSDAGVGDAVHDQPRAIPHRLKLLPSRLRSKNGGTEAFYSTGDATTRSSWWDRSKEAKAVVATFQPPYMDEQTSAEVRHHVSRYASIIPATAFEAARSCDEVFALQLDVAGYRRVLLPELVEAQPPPQQQRQQQEENDELPQEGTAALGRLALHAHLARYLYGIHGECGRTVRLTSTTAVGNTPDGATYMGLAAVATAAGDTPAADSVMESLSRPSPSPSPSLNGPEPPSVLANTNKTAAAALHDIAVFVRPKILAGLARRLRLDLLMRDQLERAACISSPTAELATVAATNAVCRSSSSNKKGHSPGLHLRHRRAAVAAAAAAAANGASAKSSAPALSAALLRLVWETHLCDPDRAWYAVCVLAGLAVELGLVGK